MNISHLYTTSPRDEHKDHLWFCGISYTYTFMCSYWRTRHILLLMAIHFTLYFLCVCGVSLTGPKLPCCPFSQSLRLLQLSKSAFLLKYLDCGLEV